MRKLKAVFIPLGFALLLAFCGGQVSAQSQQAAEVERALDRAVESHKAGELAAAIGQYQAILARYPGRVDVRSNLGAALVQLGRFEEAIAEYKRALADDSRNAAIRFNLALAFYKAANFAEATDELKQVVTAQPENANAVLLLADCQLRLGADRQVIELLTPLDAKFGGNPVFNYLLGMALIYDQQLEKGQVLIDRILRGGDSAEVRVLLGAAHMMTQDYQNALKEFERARALNPKVPTLHALYGRALMLTGETERAAQAFRRELEINPNDFESNLYIGLLLKKEAKHGEALGYLERAARVRPKEVNARYHIGSIYLTVGKVVEAQHLLEQIVKEAPDFVEAHVLLATAYYRLKRKEEGDREGALIQKLTAERQARQARAQDAGQPAQKSSAPIKLPH